MTATHLRIQLVRDREAFKALRPAWMELHTAARGSVFQSFEWQSTWWDVYGDIFHLRMLALWDGERLAALLPFFRQSLDLKVCRLSRFRFAGEYETYGEYQPLVLPELEDAAAAAAAPVLASFLLEKSCDCLDFNSLPAESPFMNRLLPLLENAGYQVRRKPLRSFRMMMPLPADTDAYMKSLSSHGRADIRRDERQLFKRGVQHETLSADVSEERLNAFFALHEEEWGRKLGGGFFKERNRFGDFLRRATTELMKRNAVRLHFLMAEDKPIAATQAFMMNGRCAGYVSGFDFTHPLARYSPGKVLSSLCIRDAIGAGCVEFDFLGGRERYKHELGGQLTGFSHAIIFRKGLRGLKPRFFLLLLAVQRKYWHLSDWDGTRARNGGTNRAQ